MCMGLLGKAVAGKLRMVGLCRGSSKRDCNYANVNNWHLECTSQLLCYAFQLQSSRSGNKKY